LCVPQMTLRDHRNQEYESQFLPLKNRYITLDVLCKRECLCCYAINIELRESLRFTSVSQSKKIDRTSWTGEQPAARTLPIHKHAYLEWDSNPPTILMFERAKTAHSLDSAATVIGNFTSTLQFLSASPYSPQNLKESRHHGTSSDEV
jgi:hypothetical protein